LIKDAAGHKFGYENGKFVNEIPGAHDSMIKGGLRIDHEPIYDLPEGQDYQVMLDGANGGQQSTDSLAVFGQGLAAEVNNITVDANSNDALLLNGDGTKVTFKADGNEAPDIRMAIDENGHSYEVDISGIDLKAGEEVDLVVDEATGRLALHDSGNADDKYDLAVKEFDASGEHSFQHKNMDIKNCATEDIEFGTWTGQGPLAVGIDQDGNGTIDQTITEDNQP